MTRSPRLPTDPIDTTGEHGGSCGTDEHGRRYVRTRVEVSADSENEATCTLDGPADGFIDNDLYSCRINVRYKTKRMGSNVWCSGIWYGRAVGRY